MLPTRTLLLAAVAAALALLVGRAWSRGGSALSRVARAALVLAAFLGLVVATKAMYVVSASNAFAEYRYNLSLGYFHAFCVFVLLALARPALVRGVALGFVVVLLVLFAQSDLLRQGVLLRGQEHDLALANRVLYRIESLPDLDLSREYFLVRVGHYPRFRMNAMRSKGHGFDRGGDTHMDSGEITALWSPSAVMDMLGSKVRWKTDGGVLPDAVAKIREARSLCLDQGRKPWPDASSVFIHGDWVVVYMEESGRPAAAAPSGGGRRGVLNRASVLVRGGPEAVPVGGMVELRTGIPAVVGQDQEHGLARDARLVHGPGHAVHGGLRDRAVGPAHLVPQHHPRLRGHAPVQERPAHGVGLPGREVYGHGAAVGREGGQGLALGLARAPGRAGDDQRLAAPGHGERGPGPGCPRRRPRSRRALSPRARRRGPAGRSAPARLRTGTGRPCAPGRPGPRRAPCP